MELDNYFKTKDIQYFTRVVDNVKQHGFKICYQGNENIFDFGVKYGSALYNGFKCNEIIVYAFTTKKDDLDISIIEYIFIQAEIDIDYKINIKFDKTLSYLMDYLEPIKGSSDFFWIFRWYGGDYSLVPVLKLFVVSNPFAGM